MELEWRAIPQDIQQAIHDAQLAWIGTRYSSHQKEIGCGINCYNLMGRILDTLYRRQVPTDLPVINTNIGAASDGGKRLVSSFLHGFPLEAVTGCVEPGDIIVMRSIPGSLGPNWVGHAMMAGCKPGLAIHAMPATGVTWGSLASTIGRVVRIYRPQDKHLWAQEI